MDAGNPDESGDHFRLLGRVRDAFPINGKVVTTAGVDACFAGLTGVAHYQLAQTATDRFRLRYIPDGPFPASPRLAKLQDELKSLLGPESDIVLEPVEQLLAERSGKFRLTVPLAEPVR